MHAGNETALNEGKSNQPVAEKKSSLGCVFYGCLFSFLLMLLLVVGVSFAGYWFLKEQVNRYTSDTPADLPTVEYSEEELAGIQSRIDTFKETIEEGQTPENLVLTADEINALITEEDELKGRIYVTIQEGQVTGDVSIPTDFLPGGKGRYFNASATFDVSLDSGVLIVTLAAAKVKGQAVPQQFIDGMSRENLAKEVYKDPEVAETLRRFESLTIEDDKIILKPRVESNDAEQPATEAAESEEAEVTDDEALGELGDAADSVPPVGSSDR